MILRAHAQGERLLVEIEDECGGIPESKADLFQPFGDRRGTDRSGLGLGLSIARKAVRAHGGDIHVRNMPGKGCVFTIELPLAAEDVDIPQPTESVGVSLHAEPSGEYPATSASAASQSSKP